MPPNWPHFGRFYSRYRRLPTPLEKPNDELKAAVLAQPSPLDGLQVVPLAMLLY